MRQDDSIQRPTDPLSSLAHRILSISPQTAYTKLVVGPQGSAEVKALLAKVEPRELLSAPIVDENEARGLVGGLYLWHDHLDESHRISQSISTPSGSFWHAILHRREGDFSNSKYWYARCANHPAFAFIAAKVNQTIAALPADKQLLRLTQGGWNPNAFVDLIEHLHVTPTDPRLSVAVELQRIEWKCLFDHSARRSINL